MEGPVELSDIQRFYKDATIFLTGGTGFIGKLFLEKILRSLPVKKVFILVRSKENAPASKRMEDLFETIVFNGIKRSNPEVLTKVVLMEGDCSLPMLGLSQENIDTIIHEVNVIIHCAAVEKFDEQLKKATRINVRSVKDLVDIANTIKKLKTFIYVGTAFLNNSNEREIKEEVYPAKIKAEDLIAICESLDDDTVQAMTKCLVGDWPNTYTFTKQVAEDYINRKGKGIPICITRPALVISTYKEPVGAFVDNISSLAGFSMFNGLGISRISYYKNINLDLVPADFVVNECIAAGWSTGETFQKQAEIQVYNISSVQNNPISQDEVCDLYSRYSQEVPSQKMSAYPMFFTTTCKYNYLAVRFFLHTLVAFILDQVVRLKGGKPTFSQNIKRLHMLQEAYEHFTTNNFFIHVENTHKLLRKMSFMDRELFNFDITCVNWDSYFVQYVKGVRVYLMNDPMETLPEGRKRIIYLRKLFVAGLITTIVVLYVVGKIVVFKFLPLVFGVLTLFLRQLVC